MPIIGPEITLICDQRGKQQTLDYSFPDPNLEKFGGLPTVATARGWHGGGAGPMPVFCSSECFDVWWEAHAERDP